MSKKIMKNCFFVFILLLLSFSSVQVWAKDRKISGSGQELTNSGSPILGTAGASIPLTQVPPLPKQTPEHQQKVTLKDTSSHPNKTGFAAIIAALTFALGLGTYKTAKANNPPTNLKTLKGKLEKYIKIKNGKYILDSKANNQFTGEEVNSLKEFLKECNNKPAPDKSKAKTFSFDDGNLTVQDILTALGINFENVNVKKLLNDAGIQLWHDGKTLYEKSFGDPFLGYLLALSIPPIGEEISAFWLARKAVTLALKTYKLFTGKSLF